jgi:hypothetical protein
VYSAVAWLISAGQLVREQSLQGAFAHPVSEGLFERAVLSRAHCDPCEANLPGSTGAGGERMRILCLAFGLRVECVITPVYPFRVTFHPSVHTCALYYAGRTLARWPAGPLARWLPLHGAGP